MKLLLGKRRPLKHPLNAVGIVIDPRVDLPVVQQLFTELEWSLDRVFYECCLTSLVQELRDFGW